MANYTISIEGDSEMFVIKQKDVASDLGKRYPSARIFASPQSDDTIIIRIVDGSNDGGISGRKEGYKYNELYNSAGTVFASLTAAVDWFDDNTGKSKASGDNEGTVSTAPTIVASIGTSTAPYDDINESHLLANAIEDFYSQGGWVTAGDYRQFPVASTKSGEFVSELDVAWKVSFKVSGVFFN